MELINYAHRGASSYLPENTFLSFYTGLYMGANGIETDVHLTKDGVAVLFHDDSLARVTQWEQTVEECTLAQLQQLWVQGHGHRDKIPTLEDFLAHFGPLEIHLAIELKGSNTEAETARLLEKYRIAPHRVVVTSFKLDYLEKFHALAPHIPLGHLTRETALAHLEMLQQRGIGQYCPHSSAVTAERVAQWHQMGFSVRPWGVADEEIMAHLVRCGVDGMTVNFPDKLTRLLCRNC